MEEGDSKAKWSVDVPKMTDPVGGMTARAFPFALSSQKTTLDVFLLGKSATRLRNDANDSKCCVRGRLPEDDFRKV